MANHGPSYGMSAEVADKIASKKDPAMERTVINWIKEKTGQDPAPLGEKLKDGLILCALANALQPGICKAGKAKMPFHKMENINTACQAFQKLGVKEMDMFATVDLYEEKNMVKVVDTLIQLKRVTGN